MKNDSNGQSEFEEIEIEGATGHAIADLTPQLEMKSDKTKRWSRISSIEIGNFKAIESTKVPLGDVTILVGPNGSGKSSVLQAIHWAARAASYIAPKNTKEVVAFERLDYLPSSEPLKTAYRSTLSTVQSSVPTKISFIHVSSTMEAPVIAGTNTEPKHAEISTYEDVEVVPAVISTAYPTANVNTTDALDAVKATATVTATATVSGPAATVKIWAARNQGGISVHIEGAAAVTPFKQRAEPLTAYIPGLAGLSEKETILAQPLLRRQAASGDAGGVLRNVLFNLASRLPGELDDVSANQRIARLNQLIQSVHPSVNVRVSYNDREDININASFSDQGLGGNYRPLESAATGVLQVIQIFAYIVFFRPKILLVDEPDAHLHPDKQERLIEALELASVEFDAQIILTTHSPHIVRAASSATRLVWMNGGSVIDGSDDKIRRLMGWGALDRKLLFFVEDEEDKPIRALLRQWPELYRQLSICRCFGMENLPKARLLEGLHTGGGISVKVIIHRDRDFMTDDECHRWLTSYKVENSFPWHTQHVDVEAYFCGSNYLQKLYSVDATTADMWRNAAASNVKQAHDKFFSKRKEINRVLYMDGGGSPASDALWTAAGGQSPETVLGKSLLAALKPIITKAGMDEALLNSYIIPSALELAPDLRLVLEAALANTD